MIPSQPCSRRQALVQASQQSLALGAAALVGGSAAEAQSNASGQFTDFDRSCLRFRLDTTKKPPKTVSRKLPMTLNNVRMSLDARAILAHRPSGKTYDYVLSSSCKSEQVWVDRDVWHQPNADMCMLAGAGEYLVFKRWDKTDKGVLLYPPSLGVQPERQVGNPDDTFDRFSIDLARRPGRVLESLDEILATLFAATPVLGQTEYDAGEYHVTLEYPIKVVNFSEREKYYQVDTGPVLLPDFSQPTRTPLEGCQLAYIAHNAPTWAECIVCVPTPLADNLKVHHYSKVVRLDGVRNRLIAMP